MIHLAVTMAGGRRGAGRFKDILSYKAGPNMTDSLRSTRDVIVRTEKWSDVVRFYGSVLGLPIAYQTDTIVGFETGAFRLYVEKGKAHGPVFEFLVPDVQAAKQQLIAAGCTVVEEDPSVPRCYISDPYGLIFNIGQAPTPQERL
jgi:predicted enzyme related to lactoylglutathione lyase